MVEARDRVGGRVHTLRGFAGGQLAEAGGEYIDSNHVLMRGYAKRFGLPLDDLLQAGSDNPGCVYLGGRRRTDASLYTPRVNAEIDRFYSAVSKLSDPLDPGDPVAAGARQAAQVSLLFLAQGDSLPGGQAERYRVRGGNDQIPRALAHTLGTRVVLGAPVTAIAYDAGGVTVTAGGNMIQADACVLAAPLPALRAVAFSPALPAALAGAIAHLQYGTGSKVALQYAGRPWRAQGFDGDTFTDLPISTTWEATDAQRGSDGILLAYTMGAPGAAFVALSDEQRIAAAAGDVERIYPGAGTKLLGAQTVAWTDEPYTGGTYTAYAPGQVTAYWRALRRPVGGRIVLAGEHTDAFTAYMEGAARSGRRAARWLQAHSTALLT